MPELGRPADFKQSLDLGLTCAVKDCRAEPDTALHAGGDAHGLLVVKVKKLVESGGAFEARLEELANFVGRLHLRSELRDLCAERVSGPAKVRFEDLSDVHTRRHTERVEDDLDRRSIGEVRHILFRQNAGDDTLVTVTAGHLVTDRETCASWRCRP